MKGSVTPLPCEEGTFGSRQALHSAFECTPCGGGRYCSGVGKSEPSGDCEEGFFCRGRAQSLVRPLPLTLMSHRVKMLLFLLQSIFQSTLNYYIKFKIV